MTIGGIGRQGIVAGQPTSSVASVTAPSEGGCMGSVAMSSTVLGAPAGWVPLPHFTWALTHMGSPQARLRPFPTSPPAFCTHPSSWNCVLWLSRWSACLQTPVQALTHSTNMQPVVFPLKHSARPQGTGQASRSTQFHAVRNRGVRHVNGS